MIKLIINSAKTWLFTKHDPEILKTIIAPGSIGVISAKCCNPASSAEDQRLIEVLEASIKKCGIEKTVNLETITVAQKSLRSLSNELTDKNKALVNKITALFNTKGLNIFPITIIDGDIEFYGGVPSEEMVIKKLRNIVENRAA